MLFQTFTSSGLASLDFSTLPQQFVNGLLSGSIYALIALGYTMVYGVLNLINFAHGEVFMLGAYASLFTSWALGFSPNSPNHRTSPWNLVLMLVVSMLVSGMVGVIIERLAYRPMRSQPRIATLITAIGVSIFLQYTGQIFLPNSPAPNIDQRVNPYLNSNVTIGLWPHSHQLGVQAESLLAAKSSADSAWDAQKKLEKDPFSPSAYGDQLFRKAQKADAEYNHAQGAYLNSGVTVKMPGGRLVTIGVTIVLMVVLTYLVMFTRQGRAMRAVSHDFDSASLMGINVNSIVTFTFVLGSTLAGAAAMMDATLYQPGIRVDTFFGLIPGVKAFVAAVLGGIGNIPGAVVGGLLMGVLESIVGWAGYSGWQDAAAFVVLILVLIIKPSGLLGAKRVEKV